METMKLNQEQVKNVTDANATATATMIVLGFRERARSVTNLGRIKAQLLEMKENVVDKDYFQFWRGLEEAGAGSIILGRRGKQTRFQWNYSLKDVARGAIEGHEEEIKKIAGKKLKTEVPKKKLGRPFKIAEPSKTVPAQEMLKPTKQEVLVYRIPLRPNYTIQIDLPQDVTPEEIERIKSSLVSTF